MPTKNDNSTQTDGCTSKQHISAVNRDLINRSMNDSKDSLLSFIPIVLEDVTLDAFLDTGSDISIISEELRQKLPTLKKRPIKKSYLLARSVTGESIDSLGSIVTSI